MKNKVNLIIIILASIVLIWGIIASCLALAVSNSKTRATYAKDGRTIVAYDVSAEQKYLYVKRLDVEFITRSEQYRRAAEHAEIVMNKAKKDYNADKTDAKRATYNSAVASYTEAKNTLKSFKNSLFITSSSTFFGTYFPIVLLLGIGLIINIKVNCKCHE